MPYGTFRCQYAFAIWRREESLYAAPIKNHQKSSDASLFAWRDDRQSRIEGVYGLLATSASLFVGSGNVVIPDYDIACTWPWAITNMGLELLIPPTKIKKDYRSRKYIDLMLDCTERKYVEDGENQKISVKLTHRHTNYYERCNTKEWDIVTRENYYYIPPTVERIYIAQSDH